MLSFDPENPINVLCAKGMEAEGEGKPEEAAKFFTLAWNQASDTIEKLTAAHYVARCQPSVAKKLEWDITTLQLAGSIDDDVKGLLPSLHLNVAKGYEDINNLQSASEHYHLALSFARHLPNDGYGNMIASGINTALKRLNKTDQSPTV